MFFIDYNTIMLRALFLIVSCTCVLQALGATDENEKMDVFRLPNNTEPIAYKLTINPTIDPIKNVFSFTGNVTINIRVKSSTEELTLNADDLVIERVNITDTDTSVEINVIDYSYTVRNQQLNIRLDKPGLIADRVYDVQISYTGKLRDDMTGFYKSSYVDEDGNTQWLAVTQFEPTFARRAFPCYDEPAYKAIFTINIIRKDTQISLSNMQKTQSYQITDIKPGNYINDPYRPTELLSTYLVAFSVSEFRNKTNKNNRIFVYTHKDYLDQVTYIEEKADRLLNLMEVYTNIPYPYSKLDLLALPDMSFGAMENWGLNTYREKYLLVTNKSTEKDKEAVTTIVQHELSHQWFGDLVTCSWWNYVWLNEAFATLFEYFAIHVAEPEWRIDDMFVIEQHQSALAYDHRPRHPITASVNTPDEIEDIFDTITYNKGASVLRMLKYTLNDDIFRKSLILYLETNKYKNVEPKHLWDSFDNVLFDADYKLGILGYTISVEEFMSSWTDQSGYPVVHVKMNNNNDSIIVTQKLFQVDEPKVNKTNLWHIGLTYTTKEKKEFTNLLPSVWMNNTESQITIPLSKFDGWVIFNLQSTGFYRVNYELTNWYQLIFELKNNPKAIHVLNRAQLIDDSFNLARAGELTHSVPFTLISYLEKEDDFIPWYSVKNSMSYIVERMRRCSHTGPQMKVFTKKYAEIVYNKVSNLYNKNNSKHLTKTSMNAFSNWACKLEVNSCVQSASIYFNDWQQQGIEIPPDVKEAVLCFGVKNGTEDSWNNVFQLFLNTSSTSERQAALLALACSTNDTILFKYLNLLLDENCPIRPQDYRTMLRSITSTPLGINVTINFLQNKINESLSKMWNSEKTIMLIYSTLASNVATMKEINELNVIRNYTYLSSTLKKSFDNSYKEVELNSAYFERCHPLLHEWFNPNLETSTQATSGAISNSYLFILLLFIFVITLFNNNNLLVK